MVSGLGMILDSQKGEDVAVVRVQRFEDLTRQQAGDIDPPPYSKNNGPSFPHHRVPSGSGSINKQLPPSPERQPSVAQVHIQERHSPISGTFYIDPRIPSFGFDARGDKRRKKNPPHASFRTRNDPISLDLGTVGDVSPSCPKANVLVSARHGDINIKLLPFSPLRPTMGLEAHTRGGDIILFVPRDFSGALSISNCKGRIEFLPALASQMRVMKQTPKEALVLLGGQGEGETRDMNLCELITRRGKIVVGLSDLDRYEANVGFWKKLFGHSA
ncbi:hypothetical protein H0H92_012788 [Tricholoma furcatifolium]|nr:hypothetical protein H0H92_012788 [Tricholoma furcatifolium]